MPAPPLPAFPTGGGAPPAIVAALDAAGACLRALGPADFDWLPALYASTREDEFAGVSWPAAMREAFLAQQFAAQHRDVVGRHPQAAFLAIEARGGPVGRLYLRREAPMHALIDIALVPSVRGCGLGTAVIAAVQDDAAACGRGVVLHVAHSNGRARRLYERQGFTRMEDGPSHCRMQWMPPTHSVS